MGVLATAGLGTFGTAWAFDDADAATLKDGRWCNPASGYFPTGGQFGASRGGGPHAGQDITNSTGTHLYAARAGTVAAAGVSVLGGRSGNGIIISHGSGVHTYYGHLSSIGVKKGQTVRAGARIGLMGATGNVTGPHLHFEVHHGALNRIVDPVPYLRARGVYLGAARNGAGWSSIAIGANDDRVRAIRFLLRRVDSKVNTSGNGYDSTLGARVKAFQSAKGLVADGEVGPKTWPKLVPTLTKGAKGVAVQGLQALLNKHSAGLLLDAEFGPLTDERVRTFQGGNRLVVDGQVGAKTWSVLTA